MTALPICTVCDEGFQYFHDIFLCEPCEQWAHDGCGEHVNIRNREYFFCKGCNDVPS